MRPWMHKLLHFLVLHGAAFSQINVARNRTYEDFIHKPTLFVIDLV